VLECVVNVSEGRDRAVIDRLAAAAGPDLLDVHTDPHHHRSVFTLVGEDAPRRLAVEAVARLDLRRHTGVHPRLGVVDVVPFVALDGSTFADALAARDRFAHWLAAELGVPAFAYGGAEPTLPEVRRRAGRTLRPRSGPELPHPTAGAVAVGAREVLVAYNVWLSQPDLALARSVATALRSREVRTLGLAVGPEVQVSCNLVEPAAVGPAEVVDAVAARAPVGRAELVGLLPEGVLRRVPEERWAALDLGPDRTIEARLDRRRRAGS
jgi:glutamate formiminotransferase / 5-formyltetrahydrofolate cyclo-ligase